MHAYLSQSLAQIISTPALLNPKSIPPTPANKDKAVN